MCGIVGYIGYNQASDILLEGLNKLEYRGYDSAGVAILNDKIEVRTVGTVSGHDHRGICSIPLSNFTGAPRNQWNAGVTVLCLGTGERKMAIDWWPC